MKLSTKISVGFFVVLALHIVVAVMGHFGQERAQGDLVEIEQGNQLTRRMLEVDRLVGELQSNVQGYTFSGNRGLALRAERTYDAALAALSEVEVSLGVSELEGAAQMRRTLNSYANNFRAAVEDRSRRERLVQEELPDLAARAGTIVSAFGQGTGLTAEDRRVFEQDLLVVLSSAYRYLVELDQTSLDDARRALRQVRTRLQALGGGGERQSAFAAEARELRALTERYDAVLLGLVQSTRGYLHLVHVVMAAEAVEVLRESTGLRQAALGRIEQLQQVVAAEQARYQWWSAFVSLATIVMGVVAGAVVGRLVVQPLRAITTTLGRVTRGESVEIPGLDRVDEIGDMAAAAQRLRERNAETERLSRQREHMIEDLERTNRDLDNFAHIASHDLKAPLRAIMTVCRWLREDCGDSLPKVGHDHLDRLQQRVTRMEKLLADLQDYSRASRSEEAYREVDLRDVVRDAADVLDEVAFEVEIRGERDLRLVTAPVPLGQVVGNLLNNAARHHDRDAGRIEVALQRTATGARIVITDDGPGVPTEHHARIFEPFETLHPREGTDNSGVGLAIVDKLVRRYGGSIRVESPVQDGRGARFVIEWPDGDHDSVTTVAGDGAAVPAKIP